MAFVLAAAAAGEENKPDFSLAERLLFLSDQLASVKAPTTLSYLFNRSGSLEAGFEDRVKVSISHRADGSCCSAKGDFLSGPRAMAMPDLDGGTGNPVTMYFLEHDVREMHRLTGGSENYFRQRIRMALYKSASVREVVLPFRGDKVKAREISIAPFADDPNHARYEKWVAKQYSFLLSDAVPGGVYAMRSRVGAGPSSTVPLLQEEMLVEGAQRPLTPWAPLDEPQAVRRQAPPDGQPAGPPASKLKSP